MAYEDLQNHIPEDDDPYAFNLRLLALNKELETFAQRLNPDYRDELEDGCHGCFCSTDIDSELFTEIIFQAKRTREWLPGSKIPFPCSGRVIATEYVIRGMVRHTVESIDNFPGEAQALIREDSEYEQLLNDSTTEYAIAFEQEYRITSDGGFERDFQLKFLIEDDEVSFDPDEDKADGDEYGGDKEEHTVALDSLKGVFDTADLAFLQEIETGVLSHYGQQRVLLQFQDQIPAVRFASRGQQLEMVRNLITHIPLPAAAE